MFGIGKTPDQKTSRYATSADFCRIFENHMNRLYLLSLLLTGNEQAAEKCFVQGLADSKQANPVFKEWAESWARRTIVRNAIQTIRPRPTDLLDTGPIADAISQPSEVAAILELSVFDRFAYVLSVLEGYSLQECVLLLDCSRSDVITARMRALHQVVKSLRPRRNVLAMDTKENMPRENVEFSDVPRLAATA